MAKKYAHFWVKPKDYFQQAWMGIVRLWETYVCLLFFYAIVNWLIDDQNCNACKATKMSLDVTYLANYHSDIKVVSSEE